MFDKNSYDIEYRRTHYHALTVNLPLDKSDLLKEYASKQGLTLTEVVKRALTAYTNINFNGE